jgi:hypothetical protein
MQKLSVHSAACLRAFESLVQVSFGVDYKPAAGAEHLGQPAVFPGPQIVVGPILHVPFGAVPAIVEHDDDRIQAIPRDGGQFHAGHLKSAIAHQHQGTQLGIGHLRADRRRHGKTHRRVISRAEKFRAMPDEQVGRAEQRIADVADDDDVGRQERVQPFEQSFDGQLAVAVAELKLVDRLGVRNAAQSAPAEFQPE